MNILNDKRLKAVRWKDLTGMSLTDILIENNISVPWLLISLWLAYEKHYLVALPFSFLFFLTGLRQVHNAFHYTLGISKSLTELTLIGNSLLMVTAMHAVKYNHLRHHKYCLKEEDVEGNCAKMSALKAIIYGPVFIFRMHLTALNSKKTKTVVFICFELFAIAVFILIAFMFDFKVLQYHIITMAVGECFTGFFAVWTVHHDCEEEVFARTVSNKWKNIFTYNMFYHLEHHLFPKVPTVKLPELAKRIKEEIPDLKTKEVF